MTVFVPTLALFLTPGIFYLGVLAVAIPIIIHLLNKRRFRVVVWAAMDFLLAAQRRNARRLRFQRWILLALRCLALLMLAAGIAQFFVGSSLIASFSADRTIIFIWDDSYGMGYHREPKASQFETSRKLLKTYLATMDYSDQIALLGTTPEGADPLVGKLTLDHLAVSRVVDAHKLTDQAANLPLTLDRVLDLLNSQPNPSRETSVILLTNLAHSTLQTSPLPGNTSDDATRQLLRRKLATLQKLADFQVVDVGENDQMNRAITELTPIRSAVVAGLPMELRLNVFNAGPTPLLDQPVTISVDGRTVGTEKITRIGPGEGKSTLVQVTLPTPGRHTIEARLPGDLVPLDDVRRLVVDATREIPILMVDGTPGDARTLGSTTFLQLAIAPGGEQNSGSIFNPHTITELELPRTALKPMAVTSMAGTSRSGLARATGYAAVILSNTGHFDAPTVQNLRRYVLDGGLLMVFPGNRTNTNDLNQMFTAANATTATQPEAGNLLVAPYGPLVHPGIGSTAEETLQELHLDPLNYTHPILRLFAAAQGGGAGGGGKISSISGVQVERYLKMLVPQDASIETVMQMSDGSPAVICKKVGQGRVVQFAFTADTTWTSFPARTSYVPFMWELFFYAMTRSNTQLTLLPGDQLHLPADAAPTGLWMAPQGSKLPVTTTVDKDGRAWLTSKQPLSLVGNYGPAGADAIVVVNSEWQGADLRHMAPADFADALGISAKAITQGINQRGISNNTGVQQNSRAGELGRYLLLVALGLFAVETVLALYYSRYR